MRDRTIIDEIRARLRDPREVCSELGLLERARPNAGGVLIRCPAHAERTPSCSVTKGPDGTLRVRCFGCDLSGDVFTLIASVEGLDPQRDFKRVLERATQLAGGNAYHGPPRSPPTPQAERPYPPTGEVLTLWSSSTLVSSDAEASAYFAARGLDVAQLDTLELGRVVPSELPSWAVYGRWTWADTGHRVIVPVFDDRGHMRSVRAMLVGQGTVPRALDVPKRLPPKGYRAEGLIMANALGRILLASGAVPSWWPEGSPFRVLVCEGEPDWMTWAAEYSDGDEQAPAVFGVVSGSWTGDMAARIPDGTRVIIRTHHDGAGDAYAREVNVTLGHRCTVLRSKGLQ